MRPIHALAALTALALACAGLTVPARADGLTNRSTTTLGLCYASGATGALVPCVLNAQTWTGVLPLTGGTLTGPLSGTTGTFTGPVSGSTLAGDGSAGVSVTATGETTGLSLGARAAQSANAATLGLAGAFSGAAGRPVIVPAAAYPLAADLTPALADLAVSIAPGTTFSGSGKLRFDNLIPWQITPIFAQDHVSKTYDASYAGYGNVFLRSAYAKATVTGVPTVAMFGEGDAAASGAKAWGGNFVCVASSPGGICNATELNPVVTASGGSANGLVIASAGYYPAASAIQIQSNTAQSTFANGLVFNSANQNAISGALVKVSGGTPTNAILSQNATYSGPEVDLPSFLVGSTVASANSRVRLDGSASGNPTISAGGYSGSSATSANLNLAALGTGGIQAVVNGAVGFAVRGSAGSGINSGVQVVPSAAGTPTLAAFGTGSSAAANASLYLQGLGTSGVAMLTQGAAGFSMSGLSAAPNAQIQIQPSTSGNPTVAALGTSASPATDANLNLQALGAGGVQAVVNGSVGFAVKGTAGSGLNSGLQVVPSASAGPTLAAFGSGATPATNADVNVQALGTGYFRAVTNGVPSFQVSGAVANANAGVSIIPSAGGNPVISALALGASPPSNVPLYLQALGSSAVGVLTQGTVSFDVLGLSSAPTTKVEVQPSTSGNPGIAILGSSNTPAANANFNLSALGSGSVQAVVNGYVGLAVAGTASANSAIKVTPSASGAPTIAPVGVAPSGVTAAANADLALAALGTGSVRATAPFKMATATVAGLPTCSATYQDALMVVTDATAPSYRGALTGGGSVRTLVYCDGSSWTAH